MVFLSLYRDYGISKGLNEKFKTHMATTSKKFIDFEIQVLTSGFWPFQQNSPLNQFALPFELEHCVDRFTSFYNGLHSGRKFYERQASDWSATSLGFSRD